MSRLKQPLTRAHHEAVGPQLAATRDELIKLGVATHNGRYPKDVIDAIEATAEALDQARNLLDREFIVEREEAGEQVAKPGVYQHSPYYPNRPID